MCTANARETHYPACSSLGAAEKGAGGAPLSTPGKCPGKYPLLQGDFSNTSPGCMVPHWTKLSRGQIPWPWSWLCSWLRVTLQYLPGRLGKCQPSRPAGPKPFSVSLLQGACLPQGPIAIYCHLTSWWHPHVHGCECHTVRPSCPVTWVQGEHLHLCLFVHTSVFRKMQAGDGCWAQPVRAAPSLGCAGRGASHHEVKEKTG